MLFKLVFNYKNAIRIYRNTLDQTDRIMCQINNKPGKKYYSKTMHPDKKILLICLRYILTGRAKS